jgi:pimeloyl-ACP methyl ester carboxylesterase
MSGHATIDSVRAVLKSGHGLAGKRNVRYAMTGYSGGAIASQWAAELAVQYAPEMKFAGMAIGGVPVDIIAILIACTGQICARFFPAAMVGLTSQFPEMQAYLVSQLKTSGPYNATTFMSVRNVSATDAGFDFSNATLDNYLVNGTAGLFSNPALQKVINNDARMGWHGTPQMPVFFFHGLHDQVIPVSATDALVTRLCEGGADIQYQRFALGTHDQTWLNARPAMFEFLSKVFAGLSTPSGCSFTDIPAS